MNIAWGDLGLVLIVGLAAGAGIVAIFSFGVTALAGRSIAVAHVQFQAEVAAHGLTDAGEVDPDAVGFAVPPSAW